LKSENLKVKRENSRWKIETGNWKRRKVKDEVEVKKKEF